MRQFPRHNQPVIADQRSPRGSNPLFSIFGEGQLCGSRVPAIKGPLCFAVADNEGSRRGHDGLWMRFSDRGSQVEEMNK